MVQLLYYYPRSILVKCIDSLLALLVHPKNLVQNEWSGLPYTKPSSSHPLHLCLFAHFDPQNKIDDYVLFYLKSLRELGTDIIFVSTCESLAESEVNRLKPFCTKIILRRNLGLDFGSWRIGWLYAQELGTQLNSYENLILANDSVYGPLFSLSEVFREMNSRNLDFWAMTSSPEQKYHLQSYFFVFNTKAYQSAAFSRFWDNFHYYRSKLRIIKKYEVGFTEFARQEKWKLGAYIEHNATTKKDLNPTLFSWDELIEKFRCPFLKTEVLKLNRAKSPRLPNWKEIISASSSYNVNKIENHLKRIGVQVPSAKSN